MARKTELAPDELDQAFFEGLDQIIGRQQTRGLEQTLGGLEERGFLRSGETFSRVAEDVLGPAEQRRTQAILPLKREAAMLGREERLGETQFQRQRQMAGEDFDRQLKIVERKAELDRALLQLRAELEGNEQGFGWGEFGGAVLGTLAGSVAGGVGGSLGGQAGKAIGGLFGKKKKGVRVGDVQSIPGIEDLS